MLTEIGAKPTPPRRSARAPSSRRAVRRFSTIAIALAALAAGCGDDDIKKPPDGLYIYCDGRTDGLYYVQDFTGDHIGYFSLPCLGPEFVNETGETGYGEINLGEWTNDTDDIDLLREMCVAKCKSHGGTECEQINGKLWDIRNYQDKIVPDPLMEIKDPWHLHCHVAKANLAPLPWETKVIPDGTAPVWPNSGLPIELSCENFETCATEFTPSIGAFLCYDDTAVPWGADMGHGNYLATTPPGSSIVKFTIVNPGFDPSSDSQEIGGRIEYSIADCDESNCPFYLANLALINTTNTWELYSEHLKEKIRISDITMQLRRPTLGVWNTSSSEFYIGIERLDAYLGGTVQIGNGSPVAMAFLVANKEEIFGEIGEKGTIGIRNLIVDDGGNLALELDLAFDTIAVESLPLTELSP